jgi:hypothetical protein
MGLEVNWRDRQPAIGEESDHIVTSDIASDLFSLVLAYDLTRGTLTWDKEHYGLGEFQLSIGDESHEEFSISITRHGENYSYAQGNVKKDTVEKKDIWVPTHNISEVKFKQGTQRPEFSQLANSSLSQDLRQKVEDAQAINGTATFPVDNTIYESFNISASLFPTHWIIKPGYISPTSYPLVESYCAIHIARNTI